MTTPANQAKAAPSAPREEPLHRKTKANARGEEVVSSHTYNPEWEREMVANMTKHARHQWMLEQHAEAKATRRDKHRRGVHKIRPVASRLI